MSHIRLFVMLLRPHQWLKNLMLFFPPFLGGSLLLPGVWNKGILPFIAFSFASSAGYVLNDLLDQKADQSHPKKSGRPLASGKITVYAAAGMATFLGGAALLLAFSVSSRIFLIVTAYLIVSAAYSCCLKNLPVVDLFCISTGFLFRLQAGGTAFSITVSEWLFLSVLLLSLFLSAGKRLSEKLMLNESAATHRAVLGHYPDGFLDGMLFMTGSAVLVTYTMYTLSHKALLYTVPLCCFGLMRYIFRVKSGSGGDPTDALIKDPWLFVVGLVWSLMVGWGIYIK